jgi:hypothetical protein
VIVGDGVTGVKVWVAVSVIVRVFVGWRVMVGVIVAGVA